MNTHEPHDYPDALLDRGLAELLGGETPPDLSERILAAAQLTATEPVTLAQGNATMSTATIKQSPRLRSWAILAATIACIATVIGLFLPTRNAARRLSDQDNLAQVQSEKLDRALAKEQPSPQAPLAVDADSGLWGQASPAEMAKAKDEVMMTVTPHIIIQEEEEERLGIDQGEEQSGESSVALPTFETITPTETRTVPDGPTVLLGGFKSKSEGAGQNDAELFARNLGRGGAYGAPTAGTPILSKVPYVERKFRNLSDESGDHSQRFRIDARPGIQAGDNFSLSLGLEHKTSDEFGDGYYSLDQSSHQLSASPVELMTRVELVLRAAGSSAGNEISIEDVNTLIAMKERALTEKRYQTPEAQKAYIAELVTDISKLRKIQQRILRRSSRDQYTPIHENPFITAIGPEAVSTFSIDVDTASYANVRQFLEQSRQLPPPDAVRIEELVNYFDYDYTGPTDDTPFAANMEIAGCPWNPEHRLARIAIKGKDIDRAQRPQSNLVFLIDVSGSMDEPNKLPLLVEGMKVFTRELGENDKVAIVVYASSEGLALNSTRGNEQETILAALDQLRAGGSTAGGAGINLAYQVATDHFIEGGTNRVILCTDGDFNVGVTSTDELTRLAEEKAKTGVFLTVLGFGRGNLNDAMMESISGKGNGNYHYVDNLTEARKVLVEEMVGTLITIAKDVKIQVEFNPAQVAGYRLIGYENRMLKTEDFNNDKKDAGEIGAGHTVTALYEIVPAGKDVAASSVDPLKYQQPEKPREYGGRGEYGGRDRENGIAAKPQTTSNELLTLKLRYKLPDADKSTKLEFPITDKRGSFAEATKDFQFAAAVASFGMLLRHSEHQGDTSFDAVSEIAQSALGSDPHGYRAEFLELVRLAKELTGEQPSSTTDPSTSEGP